MVVVGTLCGTDGRRDYVVPRPDRKAGYIPTYLLSDMLAGAGGVIGKFYLSLLVI